MDEEPLKPSQLWIMAPNQMQKWKKGKNKQTNKPIVNLIDNSGRECIVSYVYVVDIVYIM